MRDMLGNTLEVGSFVAYGARSGNSGQLRLGIITNPSRRSIVSGRAEHSTYDWRTKKEVDRYYFECSGVQGHGVDEGKLLKLDQALYPDQYSILYEKAKKYL